MATWEPWDAAEHQRGLWPGWDSAGRWRQLPARLCRVVTGVGRAASLCPRGTPTCLLSTSWRKKKPFPTSHAAGFIYSSLIKGGAGNLRSNFSGVCISVTVPGKLCQVTPKILMVSEQRRSPQEGTRRAETHSGARGEGGGGRGHTRTRKGVMGFSSSVG